MPTSRPPLRPLTVQQLLRTMYVYLQEVSWQVVLLVGGAHFLVSWLALRLAGEGDLLSFSVFWYFYWTTATTVGYGDLSPATSAGRYVVTTFVMPGGIALFTTVIARAAQSFAEAWRKRMKGQGSYAHLSGHMVILGWSGYRSLRLREMLAADSLESREMVVVADLDENPAPGNVQFVRTGSLSDTAALQRAGVPGASVIIVFTEADSDTLTAALAAGAMNREAHLVAFFMERSAADILSMHCPNAECVVSLSVENTVRASQDPGSSTVINTLLSPEGQTQYMLTVPDRVEPLPYERLFLMLKLKHDATLLGLRNARDGLVLNPALDYAVRAGDELFVMTAGRLQADAVDWAAAVAPGEVPSARSES